MATLLLFGLCKGVSTPSGHLKSSSLRFVFATQLLRSLLLVQLLTRLIKTGCVPQLKHVRIVKQSSSWPPSLLPCDATLQKGVQHGELPVTGGDEVVRPLYFGVRVRNRVQHGF